MFEVHISNYTNRIFPHFQVLLDIPNRFFWVNAVEELNPAIFNDSSSVKVDDVS